MDLREPPARVAFSRLALVDAARGVLHEAAGLIKCKQSYSVRGFYCLVNRGSNRASDVGRF